jgi:tetratricopeptide (TPR) repeat protein
MIPLWLAALVLVLLLAVMGVGGYILGVQLTGGPPPSTEEEFEIDRWERTVEENPSDMQAVLSLGYAYQQAEQYDEALAEYERVLAEFPTETAALYNTGIIYFETGRDDEAETILWDVLEIDDSHVLAAKALGEYYAEQREYRSLVEAVRPVVEKNESAADLQYLMGFAYENLGREDWAGVRYRLALKYFPDMAEAKEGLERLGASE